MGLHTWEDRLLCLGNAIIRDMSLIISRDPVQGLQLCYKRQAPCSGDNSKVEFVVTLPEKGHFKSCHPWTLVDKRY